MDFPGLSTNGVAVLKLVDDIGLTGSSEEGWHPVDVRHDVVIDGAGLDDTWPADQARHAETAFPRGSLLAEERSGTTVGPGHFFSPVVGAVHNNRVIGQAEIVELL